MLSNITYCENISDIIISQPLNLTSTLIFLVVALMLFFEIKNKNQLNFKFKVLIILVGLIGIGSAIRHFYPSDITVYFDILPIVLFSLAFAYYLIFKITKNKNYTKIGLVTLIIYMGLSSIILRTYFNSELINGAYEYLSLIFLFVCVLIYSYLKKLHFFKYLLALFILFIVSIFFRQIDLIICKTAGFWTHFIWHIINAITIYFSVKLFINHEKTTL